MRKRGAVVSSSAKVFLKSDLRRYYGRTNRITYDTESLKRYALGMEPVKVLNIDPPEPPKPSENTSPIRMGWGSEVSNMSQRMHELEMQGYRTKQRGAAIKYNKLWKSDPTKFVQTLDKDLASGTITQKYYDSQFNSKQKQTH